MSENEQNPSVDFAELVYPPYHGEPTHPDPSRLIVPINSVQRDPENARLHPDRNLRHIRASLRRRGQQTPLNVDRTGKILKGNGTHESAELEDWTHVWIVVSALEGPEATAYGIADNASGLSSAWDYERLGEQVSGLKEFDDTDLAFSSAEMGFEDDEVLTFTRAEWKPPSAEENGSGAPASETPKDGPGKDPHADLEEGDRASDDCSIVCTPNQRITINDAIERFRLINADFSITEGRSIELICADYLAGAPLPPHGFEGERES